MESKIVFLDRDGIINKEVGDYVYEIEKFEIAPETITALQKLKKAGYKLVVVTNQGGIARGRYTNDAVKALHQHFQELSGGILDHLYYAPYVDEVSKSLMRKPDSLMIERGLAKYGAKAENCWLFGDAGRDIEAAAKVGVKGILVPSLKETEHHQAVYVAKDVAEAVDYILAADNREV
jgi:D-glycero-D-manno-heptose 1,7-bisphosphate phosphatase